MYVPNRETASYCKLNEAVVFLTKQVERGYCFSNETPSWGTVLIKEFWVFQFSEVDKLGP